MLNKPLKILINIILLLLFVWSAWGQIIALPGQAIKTGDTSKSGGSSFKFGFSYSSNNVFMGHTDSAATPSVIPQIKYTLKSGFYFSGSLYYTPNKKTNKLDGGDLTAGYDFDITDDLSGGASYSKQFYRSNSTEVTSFISSAFSFNLDYDFDFISPSVSADYILNKQGAGNDFFASLAIDHDFIARGIFGDKDLLLMSPGITANTGTTNTGSYSVLNYEISAPLIYKTGHLFFLFAPVYSIAVNGLPGIITTGPPKTSVFYFDTGVFLKF